ncbi:MAG: ABC transporter substrate-binding protein [Planctomycetes bacterium]|nr:ABC transporter substrate-binding protein [Planctomycetota bacterium]
MHITLAHSPDPDDAFMFYALAHGKIPAGEFEITHHLSDIESLNQAAAEGRFEVTAVSYHAYAYLADRYLLTSCGASFGDRCGPILVAREPLEREDLTTRIVAVPGVRTSAYLALKLWAPKTPTAVFPFDQILEAVRTGAVDAGLLIHEGQLTYAGQGLRKIVDLGEWWHGETGLPLPLGGNALRRDLGPDRMRALERLIRESIEYALAHRGEALPYAMRFGRGLDRDRADRFVGMYVNEWTRDCGAKGREAVRLFLRRGHEAKILPAIVEPEYVEGQSPA